MKKVLVTGADGFIGKNLSASLLLEDDVKLLKFTRNDTADDLSLLLQEADFIFHLAGVNRPLSTDEFTVDNVNLTKFIVDKLEALDKKTPLLITSSMQASLDNPYGNSKREAEEVAAEHGKKTSSQIYIYQLPGIFGKWCKPNYNSVVATFSHNIANGLPIQISNPEHKITIAYIDDVVRHFIYHLNEDSITSTDSNYYQITPAFNLSLKELSDRISAIRDARTSLVVPNLEDLLNKYLYATYISYLDTNNFSYELPKNSDDRGWLAEFIKSKQFGQIFISKTKPGISRGDHWHHTKIEKFLVIEGEGEISFRNKIGSQDIINYRVNGDTPTVLDIPTGYVHAIKNIGDHDLITIFWANEILDKQYPDTHYEKVNLKES
jgi:UDP-2-acetamido-2,6-beta-L-arabino-hexul-4-ose reductase